MPVISRRTVLASLAATAVAPAMASAAARDTPLAVSWYPGLLGASFKKSFLETFAEKDRVQVTESFDSARFTQMQANRGRPNTDVATFIDVLMPLVNKSGLLSKLDTAQIPNLSKVDPALLIWGEFAVPAAYGSWGIVYNRKRVSQPMTSWGDLLRSDLKGRVSHPNITYNSAVYSLDAMARLGGADISKPAIGMTAIRQIRLAGPGLWEQDSVAAGWLKTEEIWATPYFSGNFQSLAQDKDAPDLEFAVPREGAYAVPLNFTKIAGAPNADLADRFLNHILGNEAQTAWIEFGKTRPSNRTIEVPESIAKSVPEIGKLNRIDWAYFADNRKAIVDQWNEIVNR